MKTKRLDFEERADMEDKEEIADADHETVQLSGGCDDCSPNQ